MREIVKNQPFIQSYWGHTFESLVENDDGVVSNVHTPSGAVMTIKSRYVIGCDGAGSAVRLSAGIISPRKPM